MDRLRQLLSSISAQMSVLTVSQRVAIGLCGALVAASLLWLLQWSAAPELVSLINHEFTYEELNAAEDVLRANDLVFSTRGTRIYVRASQRHNALRLLYKDDALPDGSLFDMEAVVTDQNPFQSPEARAYAQNYAKGNELAKILTTYPFVQKASVLINPTTRRRLGSSSDVPTASVVVTLASGREVTPGIVEGFAKLVAGSVAGLKPHNVNVTDARTGRSYSVPHPDDPGGFDHLAIQKRHESHLLSKIMSKLAYIPGVMASVSIDLDTSKRTTQTFTHDVAHAKMESTESSEQTTSSQPTEPGVQANIGTALTAGGGGQSSSSEKTDVENFPPQLTETETVERLPFAVNGVTASVSIPRSFVVGVFQARYPDKVDPADDDPQFVSVRDEQIVHVKNSVEKIVMARSSDDVEVDVYPDMEWSSEGGVWSRSPGGVVMAQAGGDGVGALGLMRTYGPAAGLGALALMSVLMMGRLVRKSSDVAGNLGRTLAENADGRDLETLLSAGEQAVGEAEVSESLLTAREVDGDAMRYQELGAEVARMVKEDPQGGAELLRRWIDEG